ncbi:MULTISPECIES: hypothetical protein [Polaromonas]|uniref:DUF4189 domain-containing protein n=1 Tax=Polaromonas aquatica TaxID=332657 RepID=A0ABW1TZM7_9BURK
MKKINFTLVFSASIFMLMNANGQVLNSGATSAPVASSTAGNQTFSQGVTFTGPPSTESYIEYGGTQTIKNVPSVSGPNLTTSNDTCMGSSSGSVNGPGFGLSMGSTWSDTNCKLLKNSRELWNMGMKAAAMALMCTDAANREALEITGYECPQTARDKKNTQKVSAVSLPPSTSTSTSAAGQENVTDPYIRSRMGLAPLQAAK